MTNETMIETKVLVPVPPVEGVPAAPEVVAENAAITGVALMPALTAEATVATTAPAPPIDLSTLPGPGVAALNVDAIALDQGAAKTTMGEPPAPAGAGELAPERQMSPAELDAMIDVSLHQLDEKRAQTYLVVGRALAAIHKNKCFRELEGRFKSWEAYLKSKKDASGEKAFGKSHAYELMKLAGAEGIERIIATGIGGSMLMEFVKTSTTPEGIVPLFEATRDLLAECRSVRQLRDALGAYIAARPAEFPEAAEKAAAKAAKEPKTPASMKRRLAERFMGLADEEKGAFIDQVREFLEEEGALVPVPEGSPLSTALAPDKQVLLDFATRDEAINLGRLLGELCRLQYGVYKEQIQRFVEEDLE